METPRTRLRRTRSDGERSYRLILDAAARLATVEGLDGLSIGRSRPEVGMSKSGLFAHFASKEELQLAAVGAAEEIFAAEVLAPAMDAEEGLARLETLCDGYLSYVRRGVFPGGCFFASTAAEWDSRGGPVRDRVRAVLAGWAELLEANVRAAQERGRPGARTSTPASSRSCSTPCSTRPTATTCCSRTPRRSTWRGRRSTSGWLRPHGARGDAQRLQAACGPGFTSTMQFGILGPLEVRDGDRVVALGGLKPRAVLALLLTHANETVSADRLAIGLCGEEAAADAATRLLTYASSRSSSATTTRRAGACRRPSRSSGHAESARCCRSVARLRGARGP